MRIPLAPIWLPVAETASCYASDMRDNLFCVEYILGSVAQSVLSFASGNSTKSIKHDVGPHLTFSCGGHHLIMSWICKIISVGFRIRNDCLISFEFCIWKFYIYGWILMFPRTALHFTPLSSDPCSRHLLGIENMKMCPRGFGRRCTTVTPFTKEVLFLRVVIELEMEREGGRWREIVYHVWNLSKCPFII